MPDLDYVEIRGRLAVIVGDAIVDPDPNPDVRWCDEGIVRFTPLLTATQVSAGANGPYKINNSPIEATVGPDGRVTYGGNPFVMLVDLGSMKITPRLLRTEMAYRVDYLSIRSQGLDVNLPSFSFHPLPEVVNDLTLLAPLPTRLW